MSTFSGDTGVISNNCWYYWTHPRDTDMHYSSCSLWHPSHLSILFKLDPSYPYSSGSKEVTMGNNPSRWWYDIKMAKTYSLNSFWYDFADNNGWADWSSVCSTACLVENKPLCSLLCSLFRVTKKYCFPAWIASERQSIKHKTKSRKCYFKCWLETEIKGFLCFLQRVFEAKKKTMMQMTRSCMMEIGDVKIASKGYSLLLSGSIKVLIQSAWSLKCLPGKYVCLMYMRDI